MAINNKSDKGKHRVHLFTPLGKAVGCGWSPASHRWTALLQADCYHDESAYLRCTPCLAKYTYPSFWQAAPSTSNPVESASDTSTVSNYDDVDTASEAEAVGIHDLFRCS